MFCLTYELNTRIKLFNMDRVWSTIPIFKNLMVSSTYHFQKVSSGASKKTKLTINIPTKNIFTFLEKELKQ